MVKLVFKPEENDCSISGVESKTSKYETKIKSEVDFVNVEKLNPFKEIEQLHIVPVVSEKKKIVGLENCEYIIKSWYTSCVSDISKKFLVLVGPTGCGKTLLVETFCKENCIIPFFLRVNDSLKTKKELLKEISNFIDYTTGENFFTRKKLQKIIIIDEYINGDLLSTTDIINLFLIRSQTADKKINKEYPCSIVDICPVLIIAADAKGSKMSDLKKAMEVYYINEIPRSIIKNWISTEYELDSEVLEKILDICKSDKRLILNTLEYISVNGNSPDINSFRKDTDLNMFDFVTKLFNNVDEVDIDDVFVAYDTDGYILSNLVHENYLDYSDDIHRIAKSAESISYAETYLSDMYDSVKKFSPGIHCIYSMYIPGYFSRSAVKKNKCQNRSAVISNRYNIFLNNKKIIDKINKFALKESNGTEIKESSGFINTRTSQLDITDIFIIKNIINHDLVKEKGDIPEHKIDFIRKLVKGISIEKLELMYKHFNDFRKINDKEPKTKIFTIKFKEKLNKILN
jgi:hypothetical protein